MALLVAFLLFTRVLNRDGGEAAPAHHGDSDGELTPRPHARPRHRRRAGPGA